MTAPIAVPKLLTDDEERDLMLNAVYTATAVDGREGLPDEELRAIANWAVDVRINQSLLDNVLSGAMYIRWNDGDPSFSMTPKGEAEAKQLVEESVRRAKG